MLELPSWYILFTSNRKNVGLAVVLKYTILSTVPDQAGPHFLFAKCTEAFVPTAFNFNLTEIHGQKLFSFSVCSIGAVSRSWSRNWKACSFSSTYFHLYRGFSQYNQIKLQQQLGQKGGYLRHHGASLKHRSPSLVWRAFPLGFHFPRTDVWSHHRCHPTGSPPLCVSWIWRCRWISSDSPWPAAHTGWATMSSSLDTWSARCFLPATIDILSILLHLKHWICSQLYFRFWGRYVVAE